MSAYGTMRLSLVQTIRDNHLSPAEVAEILQAQRTQFPEIDAAEIQRYRDLGTTWRPIGGRFDPEWWAREGKAMMAQAEI